MKYPRSEKYWQCHDAQYELEGSHESSPVAGSSALKPTTFQPGMKKSLLGSVSTTHASPAAFGIHMSAEPSGTTMRKFAASRSWYSSSRVQPNSLSTVM